jgi:transposase-like protein
MLTDEQRQAYLRANHKCPYCRNEDIVGGSYEYEGDHIYQDVKCLVCGRTWTDEFTLTGITEAEPAPAEKEAADD